MILSVIFIIFGQFPISKSQVADSEINLTTSLINHLNARNCIFISDSQNFDIFKKIKFSTFVLHIFSSCKTSEELSKYIQVDRRYMFELVKFKDSPTHKTVIVWKANVEEINSTLEKVIYRGRLKHFDWIIIINEQNVSKTHLSKIKYGHYESNFLIVSSNGQKYQISEVYNIRPYYKTFVKTFGVWNNETGLSATNDYISSRRFNLEKSPLMLNTLRHQTQHFEFYPAVKNLYEFWNEMGRIMNFSSVNLSSLHYDLVEVPNIHDFVDANLNLFPWNTMTAQMLNYNIVPLWPIKVNLHVKYVTDSLTGFHSLLRPFSTKLWLLISIWLIISTSAFTICDYLINKYFSGLQFKKLNWIDCIFTPLETLLNQGRDHLSTSSTRILFISVLAKTVIFMPLYTGAVVSFLTITNPYYPFQDLEGFLNDGTYQLLYVKKSYLTEYFQLANNSLAQEFHEKYLASEQNSVASLLEQLNITCYEKKFAFLSLNDEHLSLIKFSEDFKNCKILQIPQVIFKTISGMFTNYDSSLTSVFKYNWMRFENFGIANKMRLRLRPPQEEESTSDFEAINLSNIIPALEIIGLAVIASVAIFICEVVYSHVDSKILAKRLNRNKGKRSVPFGTM